MAEAFLNQLFATENEDTECPVCHEIYGTLGDKGETERKMSLQCGHTIGSMCAHKWFTSNNTCPHCRKELFPAQSDPSDDHEIIEDAIPNSPTADRAPDSDEDADENADEDADEDADGDAESPPYDSSEVSGEGEGWDEDAETFDEIIMEDMARLFPDRDVLEEVKDIAEPISEAMKDLDHHYTDGFGLATVAALSIYIASHLVDHPKSCEEIEREILLGQDLVSQLYTKIWDVREELINDSLEVEDMDSFEWPPLS